MPLAGEGIGDAADGPSPPACPSVAEKRGRRISGAVRTFSERS
jgi:hypothetical protein